MSSSQLLRSDLAYCGIVTSLDALLDQSPAGANAPRLVALVRAGATFINGHLVERHPDGTMVRMTCYTADYQGVLQSNGEIEEMVWLTHADRHRVSPVDQIIFDYLHETARMR